MDLEVLIIDDDEVVVFIQKKMMAHHDISKNPKTFKRAEAALAFLDTEDNGDTHYLILLDINMPEMTGWEFLKILDKKVDKERFHIIMVTSSVEKKDKEIAKKFSTVKEFLEKPITSQSCKAIKEIPEISHFFQTV